MKAAKTTGISPLSEFFGCASSERKRDVYTLVLSRAIKSQLEVEEKAKTIITLNRKAKATS